MRIPEDLENTLTVFFFAALIGSMALYLYFYPPSREAFFETGLLSSRNTIDPHDYFLLGNSTVGKNENVTWILQVISHMPDAQYIEWRVKLLNDSSVGVNSGACLQSPLPDLFETRQLLLPGNTWNYPVHWTITGATRTGNNTQLTSMTFNQTSINPRLLIPAMNATGYRLLFELWYFDHQSGSWRFDFPFNYEGTPGLRCWWVQIHFYVYP